MLPSECADRLASGAADIGLVPIASLATIPELNVVPGCTIASKDCVRSLLLVRRARQPLESVRSVAADIASRTTIAYARLLFKMWGNPSAEFVPMPADLDTMLARADAAIVIGDPALFALEERANRAERSEEELAYHDLAHEWRAQTGLPFISAVWGITPSAASIPQIAEDHSSAPATMASPTSTRLPKNGRARCRCQKAQSDAISVRTSTTFSIRNALKACAASFAWPQKPAFCPAINFRSDSTAGSNTMSARIPPGAPFRMRDVVA